MDSVRQEAEENTGSEDYDESEEEDEEEETSDRVEAKQDVARDTHILDSDNVFVLQDLHQDQNEMATSSTSADGPLVEQFETLRLDNHDISDLSDDRLSRSPPQSRRPYPHAHEDEPDGKEPEDDDLEANKDDIIKNKVASDITKKRAQQQRKYHSKRSTRSAGRAHGSKAKQDKTVRLSEHGGFWG